MSRSTDPGHFFQTSTSLSESDRKATKSKNNLGNPIQLSSKLLAVIPDLRSENAVLVAESAGSVRRVVIDQPENTKTQETYTGPLAPLTSLTLSPDSSVLFAGCWDKAIWSWDLASRQQRQKYLGHSDFVKCVKTARLYSTSSPSKTSSTEYLDVLISGSADGSIIIWNIATGAKLHVLKPGSRGVLDLAICPISLLSTAESSEESSKEDAENGIDLFSAHSDKAIHHFYLTSTSATQLTTTDTNISNNTSNSKSSSSAAGEVDLSTAHATSVDALYFHPLSSTEVELWTASADKTAQGFSYLPPSISSTPISSSNTDSNSKRNNSGSESRGSWTLDTTLPHPDFVRAVLVVVNYNNNNHPVVIVTACRDENVRVWDASSGEEIATLQGHWEEVTSLCALRGSSSSQKSNNKVVSVSIDGTVRSWDIDAKGLEEARRAEEEWNSGASSSTDDNNKKGGGKGVELTEEEERELAELMDEDDD